MYLRELPKNDVINMNSDTWIQQCGILASVDSFKAKKLQMMFGR